MSWLRDGGVGLDRDQLVRLLLEAGLSVLRAAGAPLEAVLADRAP
ncbi:MAG: hypothetical protein ACRDUY_12320 [Nitriliruptorales bacterium]